ncbi:MAG TPA: hypothetical protein ENI80_08600 [Acidiferrobacteraceae bacterium]|nr:hypothetical protein [Acidiferrobacteraceae bacterium]
MTTEIINLIKERWPLVVGGIGLLVFIVVASQYVYQHGVTARNADNDPCVIKLLIETESGGQQWMTISPKDNAPSRADFEEETRIHRVEITSCL